MKTRLLSRLRPRSSWLTLLLLAAAGCAHQPMRPTLISSADATGYALRYPDALSADADTFAAHKREAQTLTSGLVAHARDAKMQDAFLVQVVDQADADGRRESFAQALRSDVVVRRFWDDERGPIGARVAGATQKQVTEAGCNVSDTQPAVQQALRASFDRQLERRVRAQSEAHRLLEQAKAQLPPATLASMQKLVDEIALNSYLVNVALVEDADTLSHRASELEKVDASLQRASEQERQLQASGRGGAAEQKASQERMQHIQSSRTALAASRDKAARELTHYEEQVQQARNQYVQALNGVKTVLSPPPPPPAAPTAAPPAPAKPAK